MTGVATLTPEPVAATGSERRRVRTPTILQMESLECGAAALAIVLAYHGRWVPLEELRNVCGVSRDGSRASNVVKAARTYGMDARGMRMEPAGLSTTDLPTIVHWNFNHFVVVEGYSPERVYLNDPAEGPRTVTWDEFEDAFTGVVLALSPNEAFAKGGSPPSVVRGLKARLGGAVPALTLCVIAGLGLLVPALFVPVAVRYFVDQYLVAGNRNQYWAWLAGVAIAAALQLLLTWLQQFTLLRLSTKRALSMSTRFFEHLLRMPLVFFGQRHAGDLVMRVQTNDEIANLLSSQLAASSLALVTSAFYLVLMVIYSWQLTLVAVAFVAVNVFALRSSARRRKDVSRRLVQDAGSLTGTAVSGLRNIETLKATSEDSSFFARWAGQHAKVVSASQSLGLSTAWLVTLPGLLAGLTTAMVLAVGGWQVMAGTLTLGTLTAFQMLAAGFSAPIGQLVGFGSEVQQAAGRLARLDDVLDYPPDEVVERDRQLAASGSTVDSRPGVLSGKLSGTLELVDIDFGYSPLDPPLLHDFRLRIEPGQRVALVGASGSGKSTVAKIAVGLNKAWSGQVLLDGVPREDIPRSVLASTVALVDQDIKLFEGSVSDNLTLWDPTISEEEMIRAARDAAIDSDIVKRLGGYNRLIEEAGRDWSGGQRQRLEIARALAGEPTLLVLDEATSALDPLVEQQIDEALRARGCACLIVAHRLSTIRDADEIVVLDKGDVVERGTHDDLMRLNGAYAALVSE